MLELLSKNWWALLVRGVVAIVFSILAFSMPGLTLGTLVLIWGIFAIVDGVFAIVEAFSHHGREMPGWVLVLEGLIGIAAGVVAFAYPAITLLALLVIIAAWSIVTGVTRIINAFRLRNLIEHEWLLGLSGLGSVLFGIAVIALPAAGAIAFVWMLATYVMFLGLMQVGLAFRLRALVPRVRRDLAASSSAGQFRPSH